MKCLARHVQYGTDGTGGVADDGAVIREIASFKGLRPVLTPPAGANGSGLRLGHLRPVVSLLGSQRSRQEPPGTVASPPVSVAVYAASPDRRRLLVATLYSLGCQTVPLDCESDAPEFLGAQLVAARPDVVIWQLGSAPHDTCAPLLSVLGAGALAQIGVVVTTPFPAQVIEVLGNRASAVRVLGTPLSLVELIRAVNAAQRHRQDATDR